MLKKSKAIKKSEKPSSYLEIHNKPKKSKNPKESKDKSIESNENPIDLLEEEEKKPL